MFSVFNHWMKKNGAVREDLSRARSILKDLRDRKNIEKVDLWVASALNHSNWEIRNIAVKVVQLEQLNQFIGEICNMILDPSEIGFIRRNGAHALSEIGANNLEMALLALDKAIEDRYWEVRAHAALSIAAISPPDHSRECRIIDLLFKRLPSTIQTMPIWRPNRIYKEKNFEVRMAMTLALGSTATDPESISALNLLSHDDNWKVRNASLKAVANIYNRWDNKHNQLLKIFNKTDLSCTTFQPVIPIRITWDKINNCFQDSDSIKIPERS